MKKTWTLRRQLNILLALIVVFQSLALFFALFITQVYYLLDTEAIRLLNNTTKTRAETFDASVGELVTSMADKTQVLSGKLEALAQKNGKSPKSIYLDDASYNESTLMTSETLIALLKQNRVTGAFVILNGSNADKLNDNAHSAVYIRNTTPDLSESSNYLLEIGPTAVSKAYNMTTSIRWGLDMKRNADGSDFDFYEKPIWASTIDKGSEIERFGYWSKPLDILKDNQQVVCYTLPLLDQKGEAFGVLGIEIDMPYFSQYYLPASDLLYHNSFYVIAGMENQVLDFDWFIPGGTLAQTYIKNDAQLSLKAVGTEGIYETNLAELGAMYSSAQQLKVYSDNSPFAEENWTLAYLVPREVLMENSQSVREKLFYSIAVTTILAFSAVFVLVYFFTRKITGLSQYVRGLSPFDEIQFKPTGMREIDELTSAVTLFNQSLMNVSRTTSKILELSLLPIGGYEVLESSKQVIATDFLYWLLRLEPGTPILKETWQEAFAQLTKNPLADHDNIYQYYDESQQKHLWLRILEAKQPGGVVGVVQDVTAEIEENRRLVNELDFDALTHLYSNTALKREVNRKLKEKPDKIGAMIFMDLDNLKYINDNFGHDVGDRLIIRAGEIFRYFEQFGGIVSRISGDEFAIYLHDYDHPDEVRKIIRQLYDQSESFTIITPDGASNRIRFSSGVAWYPQDAGNVNDLLKLSDFAMYEAKNKEKGQHFEFNREYYQQMSYLLENRESINRLLDERLIRFAFQPIIDLTTGEIFAYEALMRPLLENFKNPLEILAVAAAQSKSGKLERLVIMMTLEIIEENQKLLGARKIFINSIPSQILNEEDRLMIERRYQEYFKNIVIEITEEESKNENSLLKKVQYLRKNGIQIAVDDFGSGYSNETRILSLLPDIIKIDMEMIQGIHCNPDKQNLVANLVEFCHLKGVKVVAEGIEEKEDLVTVIKMGVDYAQGYYIGKPVFEFTNTEEALKKEIKDLQNENFD